MELRTERLILREFVAEDWRAVYVYQNDPRYLEYYEWEHRSEHDAKAFVQMVMDWQGEAPRIKYQFAVVLPGTHKLIGNAGIRKRDLKAFQADMRYEIDPREWGNGYATEVAGAILNFGFEQLHLHRIWAQAVASNLNSIRVLEKLGMRQEGRLRENEFFKGHFWDTVIYGILEEEWRWKRANR
ncbi:MAG: GNAT family N-acetyltransferase [Chloroflexi bacterium]|nr:GNAT family N-acetyltransferase [Chloroflexota bacterium]